MLVSCGGLGPEQLQPQVTTTSLGLQVKVVVMAEKVKVCLPSDASKTAGPSYGRKNTRAARVMGMA